MMIERSSLVERAAQQLRVAIMTGQFNAEQRITENEAAEWLNISRGSVRSAFAALEAENLLLRKAYSSWSIQEINVSVLHETYLVRGALEELAASLLAHPDKREGKAELAGRYEYLRAAEKNGDLDARVDADLGFHKCLIDSSGNTLLCKQYTSIFSRIEWLYRWSERKWPRRINLIDWHRPILEAINANDEAAARLAVRAHNDRSFEDDARGLTLTK